MAKNLSQDLVVLSNEEEKALFKKIMWKILPLICISYFFAFIDRVNIGYAKLQMQDSIGFTDTQYAMAAGIFFIGYALFEIPSNVLMNKIGARKTLTRIMLLWGIVSLSTVFVETINQLYVVRVLLGIFEAGFVPGVILYFTFWFPSYMRGRVFSIFFVSNLIASVFGGVISGSILHYMNGLYGWEGWQWMYFIESVPVLILALFVYLTVVDKPEEAKWLTPMEKKIHAQIMMQDQIKQGYDPSKVSHGLKAVWGALIDPKVLLLVTFIFATNCGNYAFNFWLPTMIKEMGVSNISTIALLGMIPFTFAICGELFVGRSSDKKHERRWHYAIAATVSAAALAAVGFLNAPLWVMLLILGIAAFGFAGASAVAWVLPPTYLDPKSAPVGIAMVTTLSTSAGFFAPWIMGVTRDMTGNNSAGLYTVSAILMLSVLIMVFLAPARAVFVQKKNV